MHVYVVNCCNWFWSSWKGLSNLSLLFCFLPVSFCTEVQKFRHVPPETCLVLVGGMLSDQIIHHLAWLTKQMGFKRMLVYAWHILAQSEGNKTFVKHCQDELSTIRWFQQHHAPPSVQKPVTSSPPEPCCSSLHPAVGHLPSSELH